MTKYFFLLMACLLLLQGPLFAQDKILYRNGQEAWVKVLEVGLDSVRYTSLTDSTNTKSQAVPAGSVFSVKYQDGKISLLADRASEQLYYTEEALYRQGRADARSYYKAGDAFWTTLGFTVSSSVILPGIGTLVALGAGGVMSNANVPDNKIIASNPEFKQSPGYLEGYQKQAKSKKLGNAAAGFGAGTVVLGAAIIAILNGVSNR